MRSIATSRSRSSPTSPSHWLLLADPGDARVEAFQRALARSGIAPAPVVDYRRLLAEGISCLENVPSGSIVRIETPGRASEIYEAMIWRGGATSHERAPWPKGRIVHPRLWYVGFRKLLDDVRHALPAGVRYTSHPDDILLLFDKSRCHGELASCGVPVAPALSPVLSFDDLRSQMRRSGRRRVFVKLNHGSAASGIVAYETSRDGREQAFTTVEVVREACALALYNTRRVRRLRDPREIATIVDALCRHGVHVEAWIPKAGLGARRFDLRILTIAGEPAHVVVRSSRTPMTNLHLLNARGSAEGVRARMGEPAWGRLLATARQLAARFPRSLHLGIDVAVTPGFRSHVVLEVNAFGDWLKGARHAGLDPYESEVRAVLEEAAA